MKAKISDIRIEKKDDVTKRARKDYGNVLELAESIKNNGLMHPPVVNEDPTGERKFVLVAGERRVRACIFNGMTEIPVTMLSEMDDLDRKICELEENTVRQDLDWGEQIEIWRQLDELKRKKYGDGNVKRDPENPGWRMSDTADAVGGSRSTISQDIKLAQQLRERPDLKKKVKKLPKHAARKIVSQTLEEESLQRQIDSKKLNISADLRLGSSEELIDELEDESVDLWLTDPPFGDEHIVKTSGANAPSKGMPLYNLTNTNVGDDKSMAAVYKELIPKVFKKLKPGAHIYVFFGHSWYCRLRKMLVDAGFIVDAQPLIWNKNRPSVQAKDMHYMSYYEAIFFGHKPPTKRILKKPTANVLSIDALPHQKKTHPLQRPPELLRLLIDNSSGVGDTVLDTFAGSGSTLLAARKLKRNAIGFEKDKGNFLRAQKWLNEQDKGEIKC